MAPRTLRGQLFLAFLALALIPALIVSIPVTRQLLNAVARWEQPGVERALDGSLNVTRDMVARLENDVHQRAQLLAADPALAGDISADNLRERIAAAYNLDFVQVYEGEVLVLTVVRAAGIPEPQPFTNLSQVVIQPRPFVHRRGAGDLLACAVIAGELGQEERILVAGVYLEAGFYDRIADLGNAVAYYRQVPNLVAANRRLILFSGIGLALALILAAFVVSARLSDRISRPVEALGAGMKSLAEGQDSVEVTPSGAKELESLITTFNTTSRELETNRKAAAEAHRQAAWRDAARRVAHEMRNALTPIRFSLHRVKQLGSKTPSLPPEFEESLRTVDQELEGLNRLAGSFSEMARLPVADRQVADLREILTAAAQASEGRHHQVELVLPDTPVPVFADAILLRQAVVNLLRNAADAAGAEGRVMLSVHTDGPGVQVRVDDDGPGWPRDHDVLQPYVTTKTGGTGLGLSVVQRTALLHSGSISLEDRPGGGARVTLHLPIYTD